MASMNVSVPDPMHDWVQSRVNTGCYASASDYVRDLIRRDQHAEAVRQLPVAEIRRTIEESRARGEISPAVEVFSQIETKLNALAD